MYERWFCKIKNRYFNPVIWDSSYFWPYDIHVDQKSDLVIEFFHDFFKEFVGC